jgi:Fusaric acid resistance protein-like
VYSSPELTDVGSVREGRVFSRARRVFFSGTDRLRANGWSVVQSAVAASAAYLLAVVVLGHERPFFAAIAAIVSLGVTLGQRARRAVELVFGVAFGLMVADLLVLVIGTGVAQIGVVVLLAMAAAVFFGAGPLLVNQAAISALLVVVLQPPNDAFDPARFLDALVGGGVALVVNYLFPINPERLVERAARPIFDELAVVLEDIAAALKNGDRERAERALLRSRRIDDDQVKSFYEALTAGHETARLSPTRRRALEHLELYANAGTRIDLAVINTRVLARGVANAARRGDTAPPQLPEAVLDLSRAVKALATYLEEPGGPDETRRFALEAARKATEILEERHDLAISVLVGQIRSAAVDLLRSTGMDQASALQALEETAGRASEIG